MAHKLIWKGIRTPLAEENRVWIKHDASEFWANLPLYLDEVNHSPTGFEWGYSGSGPSQLSYAILRSYYVFCAKLDISEAIRKAKNNAFQFKGEFVSRWHGDEWEVTSEQITAWLRTIKEAENEGWV
jgi:hypothetical protein